MAQSTKVIRLYSSATTSTTNANSISIPRDGVITSVSWSGFGVAGASVDGCRTMAECSLSSGSQVQVNDPNQTVDNFTLTSNGVASAAFSGNKNTQGLAIPVQANDKIYMHLLVSAAPASQIVWCSVSITMKD